MDAAALGASSASTTRATAAWGDATSAGDEGKAADLWSDSKSDEGRLGRVSRTGDVGGDGGSDDGGDDGGGGFDPLAATGFGGISGTGDSVDAVTLERQAALEAFIACRNAATPSESSAAVSRLAAMLTSCDVLNAPLVAALAAALLLEEGRRGDAATLVARCVEERGAERDSNWVCADALVSLAVGAPCGVREVSQAGRGANVLLRRRVLLALADQ